MGHALKWCKGALKWCRGGDHWTCTDVVHGCTEVVHVWVSGGTTYVCLMNTYLLPIYYLSTTYPHTNARLMSIPCIHIVPVSIHTYTLYTNVHYPYCLLLIAGILWGHIH